MIQQANSGIILTSLLISMPKDEGRIEQMGANLIVFSPAVNEHGRIARQILIRLGTCGVVNDLSITFAAETGFLIEFKPGAMGHLTQQQNPPLQNEKG